MKKIIIVIACSLALVGCSAKTVLKWEDAEFDNSASNYHNITFHKINNWEENDQSDLINFYPFGKANEASGIMTISYIVDIENLTQNIKEQHNSAAYQAAVNQASKNIVENKEVVENSTQINGNDYYTVSYLCESSKTPSKAVTITTINLYIGNSFYLINGMIDKNFSNQFKVALVSFTKYIDKKQ